MTIYKRKNFENMLIFIFHGRVSSSLFYLDSCTRRTPLNENSWHLKCLVTVVSQTIIWHVCSGRTLAATLKSFCPGTPGLQVQAAGFIWLFYGSGKIKIWCDSESMPWASVEDQQKKREQCYFKTFYPKQEQGKS